MSDERDFLSRWSRRKQQVTKEEKEEERASAPLPETVREPASPEEESALLEKLNLPVPETLQAGDDFSAFMAKGVPEFLRKRALRVLWRSNPVLANLDGLNDYDEDFTSPELTQKVLATAYQVGRGIVSKVVESDSAKTPAPNDEPDAAVKADQSELPVEQEKIAAVSEDADVEHTEQPAPRPRRMRFET